MSPASERPAAAPSEPLGRPWLALLAVSLACLASLPTPWFVDFDEAVYAEVARGMHESGDWIRPFWNGRVFLEKPALFYWLTAAGFSVVGVTPVVPRLISLVATLAGLVFLVRELGRRLGQRQAELAAWVAGASLLPFSLARLGLLDALLTAAMTVALLAFMRGLDEHSRPARRGWLLLGYIATGVAMATKGPAFPLLVGGILLVDAMLRRDVVGTLRRSGLAWGAMVVLLVGAPWYVMAYLAEGPALLAELFGKHHLGRIVSPMQGHSGPLWYYLPILAVGLLPFAPHVAPALMAYRRADEGEGRLAALALAWSGVVVVTFSLAATKLAQYVAPAVPPLAMLVALSAGREEGRRGRLAWHATLACGVVVAVALAAIPFLLERATTLWGVGISRALPGLACLPAAPWPRYALVLPAIVLVFGSGWAWRLARRGRMLAAFRALGLAGALTWAGTWMALGHTVQTCAISPLVSLARQAAGELPPGEPLYLVELNHRVTPTLATGRRVVYLKAELEGDRAVLRLALTGPAPARAVVAEGWWHELRGEVGGQVLKRECGHLLIGNSEGRVTAVGPRGE